MKKKNRAKTRLEFQIFALNGGEAGCDQSGLELISALLLEVHSHVEKMVPWDTDIREDGSLFSSP